MRSPGRARAARAPLYAVVVASLALAACRDFVDSLFGSEQPDDGSVDYTLQIVPTGPSPGSPAVNNEVGFSFFVETGVPMTKKAHLALRTLGGTLEALDPAADTSAGACVAVPDGVQQIPFVARGGAGQIVVVAALYEDEGATTDAADAADASDDGEAGADAAAPPAASTSATPPASCDATSCANGRCAEACFSPLVFGVCPAGTFRRGRMKVIGIVGTDAGAATPDAATEPDAASDASEDADAASDADVEAG